MPTSSQTIPSWYVKNWRELICPKRLEVETESLSPTYGKFVCEPLERGYGITIGNSLRRILLSSLQGAAITAAKIDGVVHEFGSLPDIVEDVMDIVLNLKGVLIKMDDIGPKILIIDREGEGAVTAGDIQIVSGVEVLNPAHHICTMNSRKARFRAELIVRIGRAYISADDRKDTGLGVNSIPIDAVFSPIRRVNYSVTNARVGQRTDYDKLTLEVWSNGSIKPEDAVAFSAKILKEQLQIFINFDEPQEPAEDAETGRMEHLNEYLFKSVEELELSVRSANCLKNANIKYIYQLVQKTEQDMLKTKNFGRKSLKEIKEILNDMGLNLGMKLDGFQEDMIKQETTVPE